MTLSLTMGGRLAQVTRSAFIEQLSSPYVTMARAKGLPTSYIVRRHVLRNATLPIATVAIWDLIRALTGHAVVVETVFAWPGFGRLLIEAVERDDIILVQAIVLVAAIIIVVISTMSDLIYRFVDPRIEVH